DPDLLLTGGERGQDEVGVVVACLGEEERAGVFGLGRLDQAPDCGGGRVCGVPGDDGQPGALGAVLSEPVLEQGECLWQVAVHPCEQGFVLRQVVGDRGTGGEQAVAAGRSARCHGGPVELVEEGRRLGELVGRHLAQGERADRHHGVARLVRRLDGETVGGGGEVDEELGGAGGVQGDVGPGEGELYSVRACEFYAVQGGVEQGRVDAEAGFVAFGQCHLGEDAFRSGPGGGHALEQGAVGDALFGQAVVEAVQVCRGGSGWRPGAHLVGGRGLWGQGAVGVTGPHSFSGARVDGHGAAAVLFGGVDVHVESDGVV